ncbi:MAG: hypothetical protein ABJG41_09765 [Cyclobacteriaceae bacterium]
MEKILTTGIWVFIGLAVVFFWLSLRSDAGQVEYSMTALAMWGLGMLFNFLLKKEKKKNQE